MTLIRLICLNRYLQNTHTHTNDDDVSQEMLDVKKDDDSRFKNYDILRYEINPRRKTNKKYCAKCVNKKCGDFVKCKKNSVEM